MKAMAKIGFPMAWLAAAWLLPARPVWAADAARLEALAASFYAPGDPGAAVLVAEGDEVLLRKGYGLASVELGVPVAPEMVFRIGSITKQFTAVAVLMLAERGRLRLDQKISEILPDYPAAQGAVRIDQLLAHAGGIPSNTEDPEFWPKHQRLELPASEILAQFSRQPLHFPPGESFEYSNAGYFVLGLVVEKVSGQPYRDFVEQHLFLAAGMAASRYDDAERLVPGRVAGHVPTPGGYAPSPYVSSSGAFSASGLLSSVDDLRRWHEALLSGKLISRASLDKAWKAFVLNGGETVDYGFGWGLGEFAGQRLVQHEGGQMGFTGHLILFPEKRLTVAVLSNGNQADPSQLAQQLAIEALGQGEKYRPIELPAAALEKFAGVYRLGDVSRRYVRVENGQLFTQRDGNPPSRALPLSPTEFLWEGQTDRFRFELGPDGKVTRMVVERWGQPKTESAELTGEPLPEPPKFVELSAAELDRIAGSYELQPGFALTVRRDGARLVVEAPGQPTIEIKSVSPTEFLAPEIGGRLLFQLENGRATGLIFAQGGQEMPAKRVD